MGIFTYNDKIDIPDVGENNTLTNIAILKLMQETAALHSDSVGYGLNDSPKTHLAWIILNWRLKVFSRPIWNTKLTIKTWAKPVGKLYFYRDLEIYDSNENLVAIASSKWILIDTETHSIQKAPLDMNEKYGAIDKSVLIHLW